MRPVSSCNEKRSSLSRRRLVGGAASMGVFAALGGDTVAQGNEGDEKKGRIEFNKGDVILFQGDSITDEGRSKERKEPNDNKALGRGYAAMAAGELLGARPELELKVYNRGTSGNKIPDLAARWKEDAIDLRPAVISILVGVNDLWHQFAFGNTYKATVEDFENGYRELIQRSQREIPGVQIVICETFTLRTSKDFAPLAEYAAVCKKLAGEFNLIFVPFQSVFDEALKAASREFWLWDGVHPSVSGHALMARAWSKQVGI